MLSASQQNPTEIHMKEKKPKQESITSRKKLSPIRDLTLTPVDDSIRKGLVINLTKAYTARESEVNTSRSNQSTRRSTNYIIERDERHPKGKKMMTRGKDLMSLDEETFKANSHLYLTCMEITPDHQSSLEFKIDKLPKNINLFKHLIELKLDTNDLRELPVEIGQLRSLERVSLSNNNFENLPTSFEKLEKLTSLHLSNNKLKQLPLCVFKLKRITFLDVSSNKISTIDKNVLNVKNTLKTFLLYGNLIRKIEEWMCELTNLEDLWLGTNSIKEIPLSLTKAKKLDWSQRYLSTILDENPIEKPPLPVCRIGFNAIKDWYAKQKKN
jgi:hypothetical protein